MLQEQLPSLLRTAENLRIKGLSETSSHNDSQGGNIKSGIVGYKTIPSHSISSYHRTMGTTQSPPKLTSAPYTSLSACNSSFVTGLATSNQNGNDKANKRSSLELRKPEVITENSSRSLLQSQRGPSSISNSSLIASSSGSNVVSGPIVAAAVITSQNSGGTVTVSPTANPLKHIRDVSPICSISIGGEPIKRKRGRPRILDPDTDTYKPFCGTEEQNQQGRTSREERTNSEL